MFCFILQVNRNSPFDSPSEGFPPTEVAQDFVQTVCAAPGSISKHTPKRERCPESKPTPDTVWILKSIVFQHRIQLRTNSLADGPLCIGIP